MPLSLCLFSHSYKKTLRGPVRRQLIEKYEARKLTARDLLGNYDGFEGNWSSQDGVLTYAVGS